MKQKKLIGIMVCILTLSCTALSSAQETDIGLGIIVGEPTGLAGKYWLDKDTAIAGAAAWSFEGKDTMHLHMDWLRHNWELIRDSAEVTQGEIPLYYGIGGRIRLGEEAVIGIRFVIGLSYMFEEAPFDMFIEVAPIMDLTPSTEMNGNAAFGVRFWF